MKKIYSLLLLALLICSCGQKELMTIVLTNESADYRANELVFLSADSLRAHGAVDLNMLLIKNEEGAEVPVQVVNYPSEGLCFLADVKSQIAAYYHVYEGKPAPVSPLCFARFVPERKDDFAWENNLAAYRMYGPALAPENPSNGVDLWLKSTNELIVDTFYYREHHLGLPYHVNYGKGLDCYKVGHQPGCGGWFPVIGGVPQIGTQFDRWEIVEEGPLEVVFRFYYDAYPLASLDSTTTKAEVTISCMAWQPLCHASVVVKDSVLLAMSDSTLQFGAGIFLHEKTANADIAVEGNTQICMQKGMFAYAENAVADAGDAQGRNYAAVVIPGMDDTKIVDGSLIGVANFVRQNEMLTADYYFGGGWSEWQFSTDQDWFEVIALFARKMEQPTTYRIE